MRKSIFCKCPKLGHTTLVMGNKVAQRLLCRETVDREGKERVAGEEWMVRRYGAYLPGVYEEIVQTVR